MIVATESPGSSCANGHDLAGNRTSVTLNGTLQASYSYDAANQVSNTGYSYDPAGNLSSDGATSYTWDALGQLTGTTAKG